MSTTCVQMPSEARQEILIPGAIVKSSCVLPDLKAGTSALSPVPNSMFLKKYLENISQVPLLFPFVLVMMAKRKVSGIRPKIHFL